MHMESRRGRRFGFLGLAVVFSGRASGEDGRAFDEIVVEGLFVFRVEMTLVGGLCEDGHVFITA